jgi:hypothetical protein
VYLPLDVSQYLSEVTFLDHDSRRQSYANRVVSALTSAARIAEHEDDEAIAIRTAMEWAFDSRIGQNETIKFLQICIGLEAILGDDKTAEAITKTLADRCAYLVGSDMRERRAIRSSLESLYKARSKIVHGRRSALEPQDAGLLRWGRKTLLAAIAKELECFVKSKPIEPTGGV